jgi:hypothetical protein
MTVALQQKLSTLKQTLRVNTRRMERELSNRNSQVDEAVKVSVAKYYGTLTKLAKE